MQDSVIMRGGGTSVVQSTVGATYSQIQNTGVPDDVSHLQGKYEVIEVAHMISSVAGATSGGVIQSWAPFLVSSPVPISGGSIDPQRNTLVTKGAVIDFRQAGGFAFYFNQWVSHTPIVSGALAINGYFIVTMKKVG